MADNKKYYYLKLRDNFFDSEAMILLESMDDGYLYSNILLKLYLRSLKGEGKLMFDNRIPYSSTMLSKITRHPVGVVEKAVKLFDELGLIDILDNGAIYMSDIQNFIGESSTEADRIRAYRKKISDEKETLTAGCANVSEIPYKCTPEREIEREIEKEIEIDIADKSTKPPKSKYGELKNVLLTAEEYEKLKERFPDYEDRINKLGYYISSRGKKYNSHYATVLNWARKDEDDDKQGAGSKSKQDNAVSKYNLSTNIS